MSGKNTIVVTGATGAQGGGLVSAILDDPAGPFQVRAITRKPDSENAVALAQRGVELVQADLDDVESLKRAFDGAYGAYCVTNFWEHFSAEKETEQGRNLARAAAAAGIQHAIWSTLEDVRDFVPLESDQMPTLQVRYKVPHFDAKAEANQAFLDLGVPVTLFYTSFYWDNFIHLGIGPQRGPDGKLAITFPLANAAIPGIAADDIGKCAYGIFKLGDQAVGQSIGIAGAHLTGSEMASALSRTFAEPVTYNDVPADVYRSFPFEGADDLGNMYQFMRDFEDAFCGIRSVERSKALNPDLLTFDQWLARYGSRIPVPEVAQ